MDSNISFLREGNVHNIELGNTFRKRRDTAFHTVRYDFKPASVDLTQQGQVDVGETNDGGETNVTITLPHTQGSKSSSTVYKGSKKPAQKECVLIYDPQTGDFTLERITSQIQVKKTRLAGVINPHPPVLPSSVPKLPKKMQMGKKSNTHSKPSKPPAQETRKMDNIAPDRTYPLIEEERMEQGNQAIKMPTTRPHEEHDPPPKIPNSGTLSSSGDDSSSSGSSSSDDDSSSSNGSLSPPRSNPFASQLVEDLQLSDSDSDSD